MGRPPEENINKLERLQRQAARFITKEHRPREPGCTEDRLKKKKKKKNNPPVTPTSRTPQTASADHSSRWLIAWCQHCHRNSSQPHSARPSAKSRQRPSTTATLTTQSSDNPQRIPADSVCLQARPNSLDTPFLFVCLFCSKSV